MYHGGFAGASREKIEAETDSVDGEPWLPT